MCRKYDFDPDFLDKLKKIEYALKDFKEDIVPKGPEYGGKASKIPWSGEYWQWYDMYNIDNLYDPGGPLEKYDQYVTKVSGKISKAVEIEKQNHYTTDSTKQWFGHCNGLSAAAVLHPEPKSPITKEGITFTVGDQKGIMAEAFYESTAIHWQPKKEGAPLQAHVFHKTLIDWIGVGKKSMILEVTPGHVKNNHPIAQYKMQYQTDATDPSKKHVTCMIWCANYAHKDFVGTKSKPLESWPNALGKVYHYWITGDIKDPDNGDWEKGSKTDHPDMIWYPYYIKSTKVVQHKWVVEILS